MANAEVAVLIAQVIPATGSRFESIPELNHHIALLVSALDTPRSPVVIVDHWTNFDAVQDTYDGTHPNENGEKKMSTRWFGALTQLGGRFTRTLPPAPRKPSGRRVPNDGG